MTRFILIGTTGLSAGRDPWSFFPSVKESGITPVYEGDDEDLPLIGVELKALADDSVSETFHVMQLGGMAALMEPAFAEHRAAICWLIGVDVNGLPVDDPSQTEIIAKQSKLLYDLREELRKANEELARTTWELLDETQDKLIEAQDAIERVEGMLETSIALGVPYAPEDLLEALTR